MFSVYKILQRNQNFTTTREIIKKTLFTSTACHLQKENGVNDNIKNVTVIGGGIMGAGIAQAAAQNGFHVLVVDNDEFTQKCLVNISRSLDIIARKKFPDEPKGAKKFRDDIFRNIKTTQKISVGCENADIVVEAIVENIGIKRSLFNQLDEASPAKTIFASNTSSLLIEDIASLTTRPEKFGGLHFFNPVWAMKLCEVIKAKQTSDDTYNKLVKFAQDLGKTPVKSVDTPGFVVNRLLFPYLMEALRFYERGDSTPEDIDTAMKLGAGYKVGPFELLDIIGLDTVKSAIDGWHKNEPENNLFKPSEILNKMVAEKKLGRKTGQGFYKYKHIMY